jgi:hypothetical protein
MCSQQGVLFGTATDSTERKLALRAGLTWRHASENDVGRLASRIENRAGNAELDRALCHGFHEYAELFCAVLL